MIRKEQWVILPFAIAKTLPGLRLSPPGVIPQRDRRPRWICDYSWYGVNDDTLPLAPLESMQFGHALDRILREILLADPQLGPVYMLKLDISDGFYRVNIAPNDVPKLGVVFPSRPGKEQLVALPLVLPMGWKNSPPFFSAATETAADLANTNLSRNITPQQHPLESHAAKHDTPILSTDTVSNSVLDLNTHSTNHSSVTTVPPDPSHTSSIQVHKPQPHPSAVPIPDTRDPCLPTNQAALQYIDVFVDDFIGLCQGHRNTSHVRKTLLHAVDQIFPPTDFYDGPYRREPVSLKKTQKRRCVLAHHQDSPRLGHQYQYHDYSFASAPRPTPRRNPSQHSISPKTYLREKMAQNAWRTPQYVPGPTRSKEFIQHNAKSTVTKNKDTDCLAQISTFILG